MDCLDELFLQIKSLSNKRFYGHINLKFEAGNLVHSEITQKLKPNSIMVRDKISILADSTNS